MKRQKRKKQLRDPTKPLDRFSAKRSSKAKKARRIASPAEGAGSTSTGKRRGRPPKIQASTVIGRAENHKSVFTQLWERLSSPLLAAQNQEEVASALATYGQGYLPEFMPWAPSGILAVIRDPKLPKTAKAQPGFLADSLGGWPTVAPRTSRDICARERAKKRKKSPHRIIRKEYYVECSCGYKGPARNNACRKCGAEVGFSLAELMGPRLF